MGIRLRISAFALGLCPTPHYIYAQTAESSLNLATDSLGRQIFTDNPAAQDPNQLYLQYAQIQRERKTDYSPVFNNTPFKVNQTVRATEHALGLLYPVGGDASIGFTAQVLGEDHDTKFAGSGDGQEETFRKQHGSLRVTANIANNLRAGLAIRYTSIDNEVAGGFFINEDDRTSYSGTMTGFSIGLMYRDQPTVLGISYSPPMRGKANVEGEEIIITEPGFIDLDLGYGQDNDWYTALHIQRWLHNRDDRAQQQESPNSQNRISYNGINFEQFLLPTMRYSVGVDTPLLIKDFFMRFHIQQSEYVFLFEEDQVPGDDEDEEVAVRAYGAKAVAVYNPSDFSIHFGYSYEQREADSIDDTAFWFAGEYEDYKSIDSYLFAMFVYQP